MSFAIDLSQKQKSVLFSFLDIVTFRQSNVPQKISRALSFFSMARALLRYNQEEFLYTHLKKKKLGRVIVVKLRLMFEKFLPWGRFEWLSLLEWIHPKFAYLCTVLNKHIHCTKVSHGSTGFVREDTFPQHLLRRY